MAKACGKEFIVARGNGDIVPGPETFVVVAGMRSTGLSINTETVDVTDKQDAPWRTLIDCGITSMSISLSGPMTDDISLQDLQKDIIRNGGNVTINNFLLTSGISDQFQGPFQITSMSRDGEYNGEENYAITLESAGEIIYTAAP